MGFSKNLFVGTALAGSILLAANVALAANKPNIVVIWGG